MAEHGTDARYAKHWRDGDTERWRSGEEEACTPCLAAHAAAGARRKSGNGRLANRRHRAANRILRERHYAEYLMIKRQLKEAEKCTTPVTQGAPSPSSPEAP